MSTLPSPLTHQRQSFGGGGRWNLRTRPRLVSGGASGSERAAAAAVSSAADGSMSSTASTLLARPDGSNAVREKFPP